MTLDEVAFDIDKLKQIAAKPAGELVAQDIDVMFGICHRHRIAPQDTILAVIHTLEDLFGNWQRADMQRSQYISSTASRQHKTSEE